MKATTSSKKNKPTPDVLSRHLQVCPDVACRRVHDGKIELLDFKIGNQYEIEGKAALFITKLQPEKPASELIKKLWPTQSKNTDFLKDVRLFISELIENNLIDVVE